MRSIAPLIGALLLAGKPMVLQAQNATLAGQPATRWVFIDVAKYGNQKLDQPFEPGAQGLHFKDLPKGEQVMAGARFLIGDSMLKLGSLSQKKDEPVQYASFNDIEVGVPVTRLHLLYANSRSWLPKDTEVAAVVLHYDDDSTATIPLIMNRNIGDWFDERSPESLSGAEIAWHGQATYNGERKIHLYRLSWTNSTPQKRVACLDFVKKDGPQARPFCVAISAETTAGASTPASVVSRVATATPAIRNQPPPPATNSMTLASVKAQLISDVDAVTMPIKKTYVVQLEAMKKTLAMQRKMPEARAVQQEITMVNPEAPTATAGGRTEGETKQSPEFKRMRKNFEDSIEQSTKPVFARYEATLHAIERNANLQGDVETVDAVQKELRALRAGTSLATASMAGYVDTKWTYGAPGKNGKHATVSFFRDGLALGRWDRVWRYEPMDSARIRVFENKGDKWAEVGTVKFDFAKGTLLFEPLAGQAGWLTTKGAYLGKANPADAPKAPDDKRLGRKN